MIRIGRNRPPKMRHDGVWVTPAKNSVLIHNLVFAQCIWSDFVGPFYELCPRTETIFIFLKYHEGLHYLLFTRNFAPYILSYVKLLTMETVALKGLVLISSL